MSSIKISLRYLPIYTLPLLVIISFTSYGWLTFLPLMEAFVLIPVVELMIRPDQANHTEAEEQVLKSAFIFDFWVYLAAAIQVALLVFFLFSIREIGLSTIDFIGRTSAMGLMCGIYGINIAHELGHRPERYNHWVSKLLLLTSLYMHFFIEHNRGHHKNVSTPLDPATSRKNEIVYTFWFRSIIGSYFSAWKLEFQRLKRAQISPLSLSNEMIQFQILQLALTISIYQFFGREVMLAFLIAAMIGILLLETVNYIEHYGLMREKLENDRYERVMPRHSWNSNHLLGRMMLFELSRHSDHHYLASRKYQILRHIDESPQMPTGYPGMILLALIPPLWFFVMHQRMNVEAAIE